MKRTLLAAALLLWAVPAQAAVVTRSIEYRHNDAVLEGFYAYDDARKGPLPGVLVVHEWRGLNDYAKRRATMLAEMGYAALAVDMYGKGICAKDHEEAKLLSGLYRNDRALMRARVKAGLDTLLAQPGVDASRVAAIGYCFGGTTVLEMARAAMPVRLVASFHGSLGAVTPAEPGSVKAKVLVFNGAADKFTEADVPAFKKEMQEAGADMTFIEFAGAVHSFTVPDAGNDPSTGMAYHADADRRSWGILRQYLDELSVV